MSHVVRCACGRSTPASELAHVGYMPDETGSVLVLANCPCGSTITSDIVACASVCCGCRKLVDGRTAPKVYEASGIEKGRVFCVSCDAKERAALPALLFKEWIDTGSPGALARWRTARDRVWGRRPSCAA